MADEVKKLIKKFEHGRFLHIRKDAAISLGRLKDKRAVPSLIAALKYEKWGVQRSAEKALVKIGDSAVAPLIVALLDLNSYIREAAARALGNIEPNWPKSETESKQVPEFITALKDNDSDVRKAAAEVLGEISDGRAITPHIVALKDKDYYIREVAEMALAKIQGCLILSKNVTQASGLCVKFELSHYFMSQARCTTGTSFGRLCCDFRPF